VSGVWFTSDLHLGHRLIAGLRGFNGDTEAHDAALADAWDSTVGTTDQVWVLGDLTLSNPNAALEWVSRRPGQKHLIVGNHDKAHPMFRDSHKWQPIYLRAFSSVQMAARRKVAGQSVLLSHFPYAADRGETRYPEWRLPDAGTPLLHGHTHWSERYTSGHELHVGVDAWGLHPVPLKAVEEWVLSGAADLARRLS